MNDTTPQPPSASSRRFKYGLNVVVLILAALVIVVIINIIAVKQVTRLPRWTRYDLTATRQYTLSPQTRQVLSHLDQNVDIVTLFLTGSDANPDTAEKIRYFSDLLDEYQRWGGSHLTVKHIQPAVQLEQFRALCKQIAARYNDKLEPAENALTSAKQTLQQASAFGKKQSTEITHRLPEIQSKLDPTLARNLQQITHYLSIIDEQLQTADLIEAIDKISDTPLPDLAYPKSQISTQLSALRDNLLTAVKIFTQRIDSGDTDPAVKQFLTAERDAFKPLVDSVSKTIDALDSVDTSEYDALRSSIMRANSSIVMTPDRITVIKLDDVYTDVLSADPDQPQQQKPEQRFRGEEAVTSAIIFLTLKVKPLIVFVNPSPQPATGPRGSYSFVASQLTNMNFQVKEWNPAGRPSPYGPGQPEPKPQPADGQPVVWVFLPQMPQNSRMPFMPPSEKIGDTFKQAIKDHQPCFVMLAPNPMARFGQPDPIADTLKGLGITLDSSVAIMQTSINPNTGRPEAATQIPLTTWPDGHPIGKALSGQVGLILYSMPLTIAPKADADIRPLIQTSADTWAETDLNSRTHKHDASEKSGPFTIAAAFSGKNERLVVISDPYFATDQVTQYGPRDFMSGRLLRTVFPGNSEFFTDSVYWLAGQDDLIATGARSQDVRRYQNITGGAHIAVAWIVLLGLPVLCLIMGGVVWLVRRK